MSAADPNAHRPDVWFSRDGMELRAVDSGPADGEAIVLLHGFPQRTSSWDLVSPLLHAAGYRTLALDQRGYCESARPRGRRDARGDGNILKPKVSPVQIQRIGRILPHRKDVRQPIPIHIAYCYPRPNCTQKVLVPKSRPTLRMLVAILKGDPRTARFNRLKESPPLRPKFGLS